MPRTVEELDVEALKLAFLRDMLGRIARADGVVVKPEQELIDTLCPGHVLRGAGFVDDAGALTPLGDAASVRALLELPTRLSQDQRLALITPLARLAAVDGEVELREQSTVAMAGYLLGLSIPILAAHLAGTGVNITRPAE